MKRTIHYEHMRPRELERVLEECPVAYVPLGALEFHGWHLPFGFNGLKARCICERAVAQTGGAVLPVFYNGFGGAFADSPGSVLFDEPSFTAQTQALCARLAAIGFRVIVLLSGHCPPPQLTALKAAARAAEAAQPRLTVLALADAGACPGESRGDHAAKWETSLGMHLFPELVDLKGMERHDDPLSGVEGADPRAEASAQLGRETLDRMLEVLTEQVLGALRGQRPKPTWYYHNLGDM